MTIWLRRLSGQMNSDGVTLFRQTPDPLSLLRPGDTPASGARFWIVSLTNTPVNNVYKRRGWAMLQLL